jgi:glycosyltransferase involved in cell wall biosynthesis
MNGKLPVTVLVATKNEEVNIRKCLEAVAPATRVVVVDSNSSDRTAAIAREMQAEVIQFAYRGGYPKKRQWALTTLGISTPWVLLLDADEVVPEALWVEIGFAVEDPQACSGYLVTKGFHFLGRRFRYGGFSHSAVLLFRTGSARFEHILDESADAPDIEIHERLIVEGPIGRLRIPLIHEDLKGLEAYLDRHNSYSTWEAQVRSHYLASGTFGRGSLGIVRNAAVSSRHLLWGYPVNRCFGSCTTMWRGLGSSRGVQASSRVGFAPNTLPRSAQRCMNSRAAPQGQLDTQRPTRGSN